MNKNRPFKSLFRSSVLLPCIVPTALSALAFWWIYDAQFSIISWTLVKLGLIDEYINFLGDPWNARFSTIAANIWRGIPFVAITRSEEHTSELQSLMRISYAVFCLKKKKPSIQNRHHSNEQPKFIVI